MDIESSIPIIKSLTVKNFTVFADAELKFSKLNVVTGENGAGKTHVLKLLYAGLAVGQSPNGQPIPKKDGKGSDSSGNEPNKDMLASKLTKKLVGIFKPRECKVGRLARRRQGQTRCNVKIEMADGQKSVDFDFGTNAEIVVASCPGAWHNMTSVFLPAHELISIQRGLPWLLGKFDLDFDETWSDTCKLLGAPKLLGRPSEYNRNLSKLLGDTLGGTVVFEKDDRFYLRQSGGKMEMSLVAEGMRKVSTLSYLIDSGQMENIKCLFWDEPEANLNPKIIRTVAKILSHICRSGTQVFVATHSIFLLRELAIIQAEHGEDRYLRYFALEKNGDGVSVRQADDIYDVEPCVALDETNDQVERFMGKL